MADTPYILDGITGERRGIDGPRSWNDLDAANKELLAENERLRDMLSGRITVKEFIAKGGQFDLTLTNTGAALITEALISLFETGGATNFLTWCAIKLDTTYRVTIQKEGAELPEHKYNALAELIDRIKSALGTVEDGDALVEVAQNARAAELALAALVQRASDNPTEHLAHALRSVKVGS